MIAAFLFAGDGWRPLTIQVCVVVLPGPAPLPPDVFHVVVSALTEAIVAEYRVRHERHPER